MATTPPSDEVFFEDRARGRAAGASRSIARAAALARALGIDVEALRTVHPATVVVVGSKGKGTAAAYASATLAAAGLRVGTLTSPGLRSNRERIRVAGQAISVSAYAVLVDRVGSVLRETLDALPPEGYIAPTGIFTMAAVLHFLEMQCDAWVLEAGMGGASDETSLFTADVLAVTPIFDEHVGILGENVTDIARDKLGAATAATVAIVSAPQEHPQARAALDAQRVPRVDVSHDPAPGACWPAALSGANARVGVTAAQVLLRSRSLQRPGARDLLRVLDTVRLPARLSRHVRGDQRWIVDAAANPAAARAALGWCTEHAGHPSTVLLCVPDGKDALSTLRALNGSHVLAVRSDAQHLGFTAWGTKLPSLAELDLSALGELVLALGTISFVGEVLELLDVDTDSLWRAPAPRSPRA